MYIETYKNENIYYVNGFFKIGLNGASVSDINFLKKLIDLKFKNQIMTPKETANELIGKYVFYTVTDFSDKNFEQTKQCALIAVDLLIDCTPSLNTYPYNMQSKHKGVREYWKEVKKEINKL